mgnify:CR=1 FL=1
MLSLTLLLYPEIERHALDTGSTDGTMDLLSNNGWKVHERPFSGDYAEARNQLLLIARGFANPEDWMLMLDADEVMYPEDFEKLKKLCDRTSKSLITLPRINLVGDGTWQEIGSYPDKQARCIRIWSSVHYRNPVHECAFRRGSSKSVAAENGDEFASDLHLWHYGWTKPPQDIWLRSHNYKMITEGKPLLTEIPDWVKNMTDLEFWEDIRKQHQIVKFDKPHPLQGLI